MPKTKRPSRKTKSSRSGLSSQRGSIRLPFVKSKSRKRTKGGRYASSSPLKRLLSRIPHAKLVLPLVLFALVGSYFVFFSKAATVTLANVEAEAMTQPAGSTILSDGTANGGKALALWSNAASTGSFSLATPADKITIRAKGSQCRGAPQMVVKVGSVQIQTVSVSSTAWADYSASVNLPPGTHTFSIAFTNDYWRKCDRNLYVDNVSLYGTVPDQAPSAQFSVSASPASVAPGGQLKVSWTAPTGQTSEKDWIGIYAPTDANEEWEKNNNWQYTNGALNGMMTFTAPTTAGTYEFRYLLNDGFQSVAKSTAITVSSTATPTPTPTPTTSPSTTCSRGSRATTQQVGTPILSDAQATACVRRSSWEPRPQNSVARTNIPWAEGGGSQSIGANLKIPTQAELTYYRTYDPPTPLSANVTGNHGLGNPARTDEIIQWAAFKWGIDEDIVRAMAVKESYWNQHGAGDPYNGEYYSYGLSQVRRNSHGETAPNWNGTFPLSRDSTAFALDQWGHAIRYYYDGHGTWLNESCCYSGTQYAAGDIWGSVGAWYAGRWWNGDAQGYINDVKNHNSNKTWAQPGF